MSRDLRLKHASSLRYVRREREKLFDLLGRRCALCRSRKRLEFDHTAPRRWVAAQLSQWGRVVKYREDAARGELRVLCRSCNAAHRPPPAPVVFTGDFRPF